MRNRTVPAAFAALLAAMSAGCAGQRAGAVATVERFQAALVAGDLEAAALLLDPAVLILESGGAEYSREEYLAAHAMSDAEFLSKARIEPRHRTARTSGDLAWVATVSALELPGEGAPFVYDGAESMVLRRGADGWKIVHIHWSSRKRQ